MRRARRLATRAFRAERREFLAEGPQAVREALEAAAAVEVFATGAAIRRHPGLASAAASHDVPWHEVTDDVVAAITDTVTPQGVVAVCRFRDVGLPEVLAAQPPLLVLGADVRDPGNAGTLIRCADAAGAAAVVLTGHSVDPYNPKAVRASVGSVFHVDVVVGQNTTAAVAACAAGGLQVLAADGAGALDLDDAIDSGQLAAPTAWLFGNEAWGLPDDVVGLADYVVRVPIHGRAESLNLAAAAVVCLYASARAQRSGRRPRPVATNLSPGEVGQPVRQVED
ncbi:MAG: TrmH family RNA methyltransferase [Nocardioidaceae bacterium]